MQLAKCFHADGDEVLVAMGTKGDFDKRLDQAGISNVHVPEMVHNISPLEDLKGLTRITQIIDEFNPDIVSTHSAKAGVLGRIAAYRRKVPSTFTAHGWTYADGVPQPRKTIAWVTEWLLAKITGKVIAVAETERQYGESKRVVSGDRVTVIYYGVEDHPKKLISRKTINSPLQLCMVAGFRAQKDHPTLLNALTQIKHLDWHLNLLGDGELRQEIVQLVGDLQLDDRVTFHGAVNVHEYLENMDILVLTTNWEGMPISTIEGLSYSLPVVATNVAGTSEQVIHNENGFLLNRGVVDEVVVSLDKLLQDPKMRLSFGQKSRELYEKNFALQTMYKKTRAVYEELINVAG